MKSEKESELIINYFPMDVELSYETIVHRKVYETEFYGIIPAGFHCFIWLFKHYNKFLCIQMQIQITESGKKLVHHLEIIHQFTEKQINNDITAFFSGEGTLLEGVLFSYENKTIFSILDIYYNKGKNIHYHYFEKKLEFIHSFLSIINIAENLIFALPIISNS